MCRNLDRRGRRGAKLTRMQRPNLYEALSVRVGTRLPPDTPSTANSDQDRASTTHTRVDGETYDEESGRNSLGFPAPSAGTRLTATVETYDDDPNSGMLGVPR